MSSRPDSVARSYVLWCAVLLGLAHASAVAAQFNGQQIRQRYDKNTKGTSIDDFVKKLNSGDAEKRLEAVKSLGASRDKRAVEYLIQAVGDADVRVQVKAIEMLGEMRATDASPVLIQYLFLRTTEPQMKQRILATLGQIGDPRAARPIMEFLHRDLDAATRGTAIFALGDIGAPESVETLQQISDDPDNDATARRLASDALSKVQHHQAMKQSEAKGPSETFLEPKLPPQQQ